MMPFAAMRLRSTTPFSYSTWNPADMGPGVTLSSANRVANCGSTDSVRGTRFWAAGKRYFEVTVQGGNILWGVGTANSLAPLLQYPGQNSDSWAYFYNGEKANSNSFTAYGAAYTTNDVIGVGFDHATGSLEFFKNGVSQGVIATSGFAGSNLFPFMGSAGAAVCSGYLNVGQDPFYAGLPAGYTAWT